MLITPSGLHLFYKKMNKNQLILRVKIFYYSFLICVCIMQESRRTLLKAESILKGRTFYNRYNAVNEN